MSGCCEWEWMLKLSWPPLRILALLWRRSKLHSFSTPAPPSGWGWQWLVQVRTEGLWEVWALCNPVFAWSMQIYKANPQTPGIYVSPLVKKSASGAWCGSAVYIKPFPANPEYAGLCPSWSTVNPTPYWCVWESSGRWFKGLSPVTHATHEKELDGVLGSWLQSGPAWP